MAMLIYYYVGLENVSFSVVTYDLQNLEIGEVTSWRTTKLMSF